MPPRCTTTSIPCSAASKAVRSRRSDRAEVRRLRGRCRNVEFAQFVAFERSPHIAAETPDTPVIAMCMSASPYPVAAQARRSGALPRPLPASTSLTNASTKAARSAGGKGAMVRSCAVRACRSIRASSRRARDCRMHKFQPGITRDTASAEPGRAAPAVPTHLPWWCGQRPPRLPMPPDRAPAVPQRRSGCCIAPGSRRTRRMPRQTTRDGSDADGGSESRGGARAHDRCSGAIDRCHVLSSFVRNLAFAAQRRPNIRTESAPYRTERQAAAWIGGAEPPASHHEAVSPDYVR